MSIPLPQYFIFSLCCFLPGGSIVGHAPNKLPTPDPVWQLVGFGIRRFVPPVRHVPYFASIFGARTSHAPSWRMDASTLVIGAAGRSRKKERSSSDAAAMRSMMGALLRKDTI